MGGNMIMLDNNTKLILAVALFALGVWLCHDVLVNQCQAVSIPNIPSDLAPLTKVFCFMDWSIFIKFSIGSVLLFGAGSSLLSLILKK